MIKRLIFHQHLGILNARRPFVYTTSCPIE